jgi:hypothetical protein
MYWLVIYLETMGCHFSRQFRRACGQLDECSALIQARRAKSKFRHHQAAVSFIESVVPPACMQQRDYRLMDFREI